MQKQYTEYDNFYIKTMIDLLNGNQGVTAFVGLVISIIIAIIGFCINKNILKISQNQDVNHNSKGLQGGRDAIDKSINFKD